jgi:hypothetical protein
MSKKYPYWVENTNLQAFVSMMMPYGATRIYEWLRFSAPPRQVQVIDFKDFQEFANRYTTRTIRTHLMTLVDHGLVEIVEKYSAQSYKLIAYPAADIYYLDGRTPIRKKAPDLDQSGDLP